MSGAITLLVLVLVLAPLMLQVLKSACDMMGLKGALPKVDLNQPLQCRMPKSAVWCLHGVCVCMRGRLAADLAAIWAVQCEQHCGPLSFPDSTPPPASCIHPL